MARKKPVKHTGNRPQWEPSPAEIEAACAKIRQEWSEAEWSRARRRYGASVPSRQGSYRMSSEAGPVESEN